jgi:hypothetical protein
MSFAERCHACGKPMADVDGPEVMDAAGDVFHFNCWLQARARKLSEDQRKRLDSLRANIEDAKALTRDIRKHLSPPDDSP